MSSRLMVLRAAVRTLLLSIGALAPALTAHADESATGNDRPAVPALSWQACTDKAQTGFQCAFARVPVDYADPDGEPFSLAVIKHPAGDPAQRIGTLFWNPGGPSDAGTQYLPASINGFPARVRARFDIVSWDPRGMGGGTTPVVQCYNNADEEAHVFATLLADLPAIPRTAEQIAQYAQARATINRACVAHAGSLVTHVSTADNARDLDLLRRAVGEDRLSYYGTSYGTFLGATYINMFPTHVRAAVLDGAVYPTAWVGKGEDGFSTFVRIGSDLGAAETMNAFLKACGSAGVDRCGFAAATSESTATKWETLLARLRATPVTIDGQQFDDTLAVATFMSSIYLIRPLPGFGRFPGYTAVGQLLQDLWTASQETRATPAAAPQSDPVVTTTSTYLTSYGRQASVICGESPNPITVGGTVRQALASYERAGLGSWPFGAVCLGWTARAADRYRGPWNKPTVPVLVVGNRYDPATPYSSSVRTAQEMYDGHLLTVEGFGHTELLNPSRCAQDLIAAYLISGQLPPDGTICAQDDNPPFPR